MAIIPFFGWDTDKPEDIKKMQAVGYVVGGLVALAAGFLMGVYPIFFNLVYAELGKDVLWAVGAGVTTLFCASQLNQDSPLSLQIATAFQWGAVVLIGASLGAFLVISLPFYLMHPASVAAATAIPTSSAAASAIGVAGATSGTALGVLPIILIGLAVVGCVAAAIAIGYYCCVTRRKKPSPAPRDGAGAESAAEDVLGSSPESHPKFRRTGSKEEMKLLPPTTDPTPSAPPGPAGRDSKASGPGSASLPSTSPSPTIRRTGSGLGSGRT